MAVSLVPTTNAVGQIDVVDCLREIGGRIVPVQVSPPGAYSGSNTQASAQAQQAERGEGEKLERHGLVQIRQLSRYTLFWFADARYC